MLRPMVEQEHLAHNGRVSPISTVPGSAASIHTDSAGRRFGGDQGGRVAVLLALWAAGYAAYRFYYAFGGQIGMVGQPAPAAHFREDNLVAAIIILTAGLLALAAASGWRRQTVRGLVTSVGWVATVGCCMHALTLEVLRILSVSGLHAMHYPPGLWVTIDRHHADLEDALFNEPWFFIMGLLCARFALSALKPASRPLWARSAAVATLLSLVVGVLSGLGAIPTLRIG